VFLIQTYLVQAFSHIIMMIGLLSIRVIEFMALDSVNSMSLGTTSANITSRQVIAARHSSTTIPTIDDALAAPYARGWIGGASTSEAANKKHCMSCDSRQFLGLSKIGFDGSDDVQSLTSTNPANGWFWHYAIQALDGATTVNTVAEIEIFYDVEFWDRQEVTLDSKARHYQQVLQRPKAGRLQGYPLSGTSGHPPDSVRVQDIGPMGRSDRKIPLTERLNPGGVIHVVNFEHAPEQSDRFKRMLYSPNDRLSSETRAAILANPNSPYSKALFREMREAHESKESPGGEVELV